MLLELQPSRRMARIVRLESTLTDILPGHLGRELVDVGAQRKVPETAFIDHIFKEAEGKIEARDDVRVSAGTGVVGVRSFCAVGNWADSV